MTRMEYLASVSEPQIFANYAKTLRFQFPIYLFNFPPTKTKQTNGKWNDLIAQKK